MLYDPNKSTWLNPNIDYIFNVEITEYDISDAGFSLIKQYRLLSPDKIRELESLGKGEARHIAIGKLQRDDKELSKALSSKFAEIRKIFMEYNHLTDEDIISVKKDAIYTLCQCNRVKFGEINFRPKNIYTSYIRFPNINNLEIYYKDHDMDIKGMSDTSINKHRLYMYQVINDVINMLENKNNRVKRYLIDFINEYKSITLDEEYYLEFNNLSRDINPMYNFQNILIPLIQIVLKEI